MTPDNPATPPPTPDPADEEKINRLVEQSNLRDPVKPPAPVPTAGALWWVVDRVGPSAAYIALGLTALAVVTGYLGGEAFGWLGLISLPITLFLILYAVYLFRHRQQQRAAEYLQTRQSQEQARREVARQVLEQSRTSTDNKAD